MQTQKQTSYFCMAGLALDLAKKANLCSKIRTVGCCSSTKEALDVRLHQRVFLITTQTHLLTTSNYCAFTAIFLDLMLLSEVLGEAP
jgi:hypothetical protein